MLHELCKAYGRLPHEILAIPWVAFSFDVAVLTEAMKQTKEIMEKQDKPPVNLGDVQQIFGNESE